MILRVPRRDRLEVGVISSSVDGDELMGNAISRLPQAWASCFHPVERRDVVEFVAVIIVVGVM